MRCDWLGLVRWAGSATEDLAASEGDATTGESRGGSLDVIIDDPVRTVIQGCRAPRVAAARRPPDNALEIRRSELFVGRGFVLDFFAHGVAPNKWCTRRSS